MGIFIIKIVLKFSHRLTDILKEVFMQIDRATELRDLKLYGALRAHWDRFGTGLKIGSVRLPNFKENNEGYTKTEPTRSDEEILKDIVELAKKHAEKGTFHNADNEYLDLFKEYVSSVSPDREGILTDSLKQISLTTNLPKKEKEDPLSMKALSMSILQQTLKAMEQTKNKSGIISNNKTWSSDACGAGWVEDPNWKQVSFYCSNGRAMCKVGEGNELKLASFYDSNGEEIAEYTPNGWSLYATKAELARSREALAIYNEAFNSVYNAPTTSLPKSVDVGNSFDVVG
jgi:hypothetical protein